MYASWLLRAFSVKLLFQFDVVFVCCIYLILCIVVVIYINIFLKFVENSEGEDGSDSGEDEEDGEDEVGLSYLQKSDLGVSTGFSQYNSGCH